MRRRAFLSAAGVAAVTAGMAVPASAAQRISNTPVAFPTVDGRVYAMTVNGDWLFLGGHFTKLGSTACCNLAAYNLKTGQTTGFTAPSIVWALACTKGVVYVGGVNRLDRVINLKLSSWLQVDGTIRALAGNAGRIAVGQGSGVGIITAAGHCLWSKPTTGGGVRALLWQDSKHLVVGGLFDSLAGNGRHGLARIYVPTGNTFPNFDADLRPNTHTGATGEWDGECVLSLTQTSSRLIVGIGGHSQGVTWTHPTTGHRYHWRTSVGDVQALTTAGDRIIHGCHSNYRHTIYGYRMAADWPTGCGDRDTSFDPGFTQSVFGTDGDNGGVQALRYTHGLLIVAGSFTGVGNWDGSIYGTDVHPRRGLAAFRVGAA